jgi:hypothetical protein
MSPYIFCVGEDVTLAEAAVILTECRAERDQRL